MMVRARFPYNPSTKVDNRSKAGRLGNQAYGGHSEGSLESEILLILSEKQGERNSRVGECRSLC